MPLLDTLASARAARSCNMLDTLNDRCDRETEKDAIAHDDAPLFDAAWFMEVNPGRPSRFTPPTADNILAPHGVPLVPIRRGTALGVDVAASVGPSGSGLPSSGSEGQQGVAPESPEDGAGAWQRTLEEVNFQHTPYFML